MKKKIIIALVTLAALAFCLLFSNEPKVTKADEYAELINGITRFINPDDIIKIQFNKGYKTKQLEDVITTYPRVKGKTYWFNSNTLAFKPENNLKHRKTYKIELDINKIVNPEKKLKPFVFELKTNGQQISNFTSDYDYNNGSYRFFGQIDLNLSSNLNEIENSVSLKIAGNKQKLNFSQVNKKQYKFTSLDIDYNKNQELELFIDKNKLNLEQDFEYTTSISSERYMQAIGAKFNNGSSSIVISFSQDLQKNFDVKNYIEVEPKTEYKLFTYGNKVTLNGNFKPATNYTVNLFAGIKNKYGQKTEIDKNFKVIVKDKKPKIVFASDGYILPSTGKKKIRFRSINVKKADLTILKVFANNMGQFLQSDYLDSPKESDKEFYQFDRVGRSIYTKNINLTHERNKWIEHELDLNELLPENPKGIIIVKLRFYKNDVLYSNIDNPNDYYSPSRGSYYWRFGKVSKTLVFSDIALTCSKNENKLNVRAVDILTGKPLDDCQINVYDYQLQKIASDETNRKGLVSFDEAKKPFYIEAIEDENYAYLKTYDLLNFSSFDINGISANAKGNNVYMYTERGVYRPGDTINFSFVLKSEINNENDDKQVNPPLGVVKIFDPQNNLIKQQKLENKKGKIIVYTYKTDDETPTGNYRIQLDSGYAKKSWYFSIETVVPEKLSLKYAKAEEKNGIIDVNLQADWLFGAPAANLQVKLDPSYNISYPKFIKNFNFVDNSIDFQTQYASQITGNTNEQGKFIYSLQLPEFTNAPSALTALIKGQVIEPSGRASKKNLVVKINPYKYYSGINIDTSDLKTNKKTEIKTVLCNIDGKKIAGKNMQLNVYKSIKWWWWEYDNYNDYLRHYKTDNETELIKSEKFISTSKIKSHYFTPEEDGFYMVELINLNNKKHKSTVFFNVGSWGASRQKDAGQLKLISNKGSYVPGETAVISFPAAKNSIAYVNIENKNQMLDSYYFEIDEDSNKIEIPIKKSYTPNIYCQVSVVQSYKNIKGDKPIRTYGIIPIKVLDATTVLPLSIKAPKTVKPNSSFEVEVQTLNKLPADFTIAVVDEGLLSLTNFKSPNPHKFFYQKIMALWQYFDNFAHIIDAPKGDALQILKPGGGYALDARMAKEFARQQNSPIKADRFIPIAMFKGPLTTNNQGYAKVKFDMPYYLGQVRVMAVATNKNSFGSAQKNIVVKSNVMAVSDLPRVLAPNDEFTLPVEVFASNDSIKSASVSIVTDSLLVCLDKTKTVYFDEIKSKSISFKFKVKPKVGIGKVSIACVSNKGDEIVNTTKIAVKPAAARVYTSQSYIVEPNKNLNIDIKENGIDENYEFVATNKLGPDLTNQLNYLVNYPYGCLEQIVSSAFPLLYLNKFTSKKLFAESDDIINKVIAKLSRYQSYKGFNYWPGEYNSFNEWANIYAGHFLFEATQNGYYVNKSMYANWLNNQVKQAQRFKSSGYKQHQLLTQCYRLYVLALSSKNVFSELNYLYENELLNLNPAAKWLLAASYKLLNDVKTADDVITKAELTTKPYLLGNSFSTKTRNRALILISLAELNAKKASKKMFDKIKTKLENKKMYSTQESAFTIIAMAKAYDLIFDTEQKPIKASVEFDKNGIKLPLVGEFTKFEFNKKTKHKKLSVSPKAGSGTFKVCINNNFIPITENQNLTADNLAVRTRLFNSENKEVDLNSLKQGNEYLLKIDVYNPNQLDLKHMALVQLLPSGWEIEQKTSKAAKLYYNLKDKGYLNRNYANFANFLDDRAMWFFDMSSRLKQLRFELKIRAVTKGNFTVPATKCEAMYKPEIKATTQTTKTKIN